MYVKKEIAANFKKLGVVYPVLAVVKARQSGKTTFLKEQLKKAKSISIRFQICL